MHIPPWGGYKPEFLSVDNTRRLRSPVRMFIGPRGGEIGIIYNECGRIGRESKIDSPGLYVGVYVCYMYRHKRQSISWANIIFLMDGGLYI